MIDWIDINDDMPDWGEHVLITDGEYFTRGWLHTWSSIPHRATALNFRREPSMRPMGLVTHWARVQMPTKNATHKKEG